MINVKNNWGFVLIGIFTFNVVNAQSTKVEKTAKNIGEAVQTIKTLKDVFGKKKTDATQRENTANSSPNNVNSFGLFRAGYISKTVKYITCDDIEPFNKGAAIIRKGNDYGLINGSGDFIVPFGKFSAIATHTKVSWGDLKETGFFYATYKDQAGKVMRCFLNAQGKIILEIGNEDIMRFQTSADKKFLLYVLRKSIMAADYDTMVAIGQDGRKFTLTQTPNFRAIPDDIFGDSIMIYGDKIGTKTLVGLKNINNIIIVKPRFDLIRRFNNGFAIIGVADDLGKMKYGVIDKKGKVRVDPVFQNEPLSFGNGVSYVQSKDGNLNAAFIDPNGNVLFQQSAEFLNAYGNVQRKKGNYYFTRKIVRDSLGKIIPKADFFKAFGINQNSVPGLKDINFDFDQDSDDGQIRLVFYFSNGRLPGLLNIEENKITYGEFQSGVVTSGDGLRLDPFSKLIYAVVKTPDNKFVEGYMNTSGQLVIIKKQTAYTGL